MTKKLIGTPTLNGKPVNITDSWDKLTFNQYLRVLKMPKDDLIETISIITGIEYETLKKAKIGGLPKLMFITKFLNEPPKFPDNPIKIGQYKLPLNAKGIFDIQLESLAQFEDMRQVMIGLKEGVYAHTEAYATYCALYLQKVRDGEYDSDKAFKLIPELMDYPASDIISAGGFFFVRLQSLLFGTVSSSPSSARTQKKSIGKRSKRNSVRTLRLTRRQGL